MQACGVLKFWQKSVKPSYNATAAHPPQWGAGWYAYKRGRARIFYLF